MYFGLKSWVFERGGRLLYLGGNGLNCEVTFPDESRMTVHNEDGQKLQARGLESRFAARHESEANLLGVQFTKTGIMTSAPYRTIDAAHWVFEGTGLKTDDLFGSECQHERIPGGASGHETDKMNEHTPSNTHLLAKGTNIDDGGAEMVIHEPDGGGAVFSTGSITYAASLLVSEEVSRVTANVIRRFLD